MPSIPGGEPPTLDSRLRGKDGCSKVSLRGKDGCSKVSLRGKDGCSKVSLRGKDGCAKVSLRGKDGYAKVSLRGKDGCAKVSLRGKDGCAKVSLRGKDGCSKVSERGNPFLPRCAATTPRAVRHAGRPNRVANLGARRGTKRRRSIRGIGRYWQSARTRRRRGESPRRIEAPCLWPVSAASASSSRSSPRWARRPATRARPGPSRPCRRGR